jgi:hypothetical protein
MSNIVKRIGRRPSSWTKGAQRLLTLTVAVVLLLGVGLAKAPVEAAEAQGGRAAVVGSAAVPADGLMDTDADSSDWRPGVAHKVLPAVVVAAVWLIVRLGYWVVRYAPQVVQVLNNYLMKRAACQEMRRQGSPWGWSFICWGT